MATTVEPELVSVNPATLEPVGSVRRTDPDELPAIVAAARAAQEQWLNADRARVLREAARIVQRRADELADSIVAETAKPRTEALANELLTAVDHATWLAANASLILRDERVRLPLHLRTKKGWMVAGKREL